MNKYSKYFTPDMSPMQVTYTYYSLIDKEMSEEEIKELSQAHKQAYLEAEERLEPLVKAGWVF